MNSFNWGIIGPGNIAYNFANDLKLISPSQKITAVLSHNKESSVEFADEFKIDLSFTDMNDFVKCGRVDIAYIATPHPFHYEAIKLCLENHIAVLCEKPIVINYYQYDEVQKLSKKNNTFLMEGMWIRFLPSLTKMLELVEQKKIGELINLKASMYYKAPGNQNNRYYDPDKGGGSLLDLGVYCIFFSTLLFGKPQQIKAVGRRSEKEIDEACAILLSYSHDRYAMLESSLLISHNKPAEIFGTKGVIRILDPWFEKSPAIEVEFFDGGKENFPVGWEGHGLQFETEEVVNCVTNHKIESSFLPAILTGEVLKIMDEVRSQLNVTYEKYE
jgi:predicted dehydrogenase